MMMNRKRIGRVMAVVAVLLAAFFLLSSILLGLGSSTSYNLFELFGNQNQPQQQNQGPSPQEGIEEAEKDLKDSPKDPDAITDLASLYVQNGQYDDAIKVLEDGRETVPKNPEIPAFLGAVYQQQAAGVEPKEQKKLYGEAGDAFAAATELDPKDEDLYAQAGQSYDQAGQTAEAIQYYNGYLDLEPEGQTSDQIEERISTLLEGGEDEGGTRP